MVHLLPLWVVNIFVFSTAGIHIVERSAWFGLKAPPVAVCLISTTLTHSRAAAAPSALCLLSRSVNVRIRNFGDCGFRTYRGTQGAENEDH